MRWPGFQAYRTHDSLVAVIALYGEVGDQIGVAFVGLTERTGGRYPLIGAQVGERDAGLRLCNRIQRRQCGAQLLRPAARVLEQW